MNFPPPIRDESTSLITNVTSNKNGNVNTTTKAAVNPCQKIKQQLKVAQQNTNDKNPSIARNAQAYLKMSSQLLKDNNCY